MLSWLLCVKKISVPHVCASISNFDIVDEVLPLFLDLEISGTIHHILILAPRLRWLNLQIHLGKL